MIRFTRNVALLALLLVVPVAANALGISIQSATSSGAPISELFAGDILTVDLVVENATAEQLFGLGVAARGYDPDGDGVANSGLAFLGGQVTTSVFNSVYIPIPVADGLANVDIAPVEHGLPHPIVPEELWVSLFNGIAISAATGDGSFDNGIGGTQTGLGDVHFRIQFLTQAIAAPSSLTLNFGTQFDLGWVAVGDGGAVLPFSNATLDVTVVPEPGTALLMGLGLAGLAIRRR
jgi:hypothetical protein